MLAKLKERLKLKQLGLMMKKLKFDNFDYIKDSEYPVFSVVRKCGEKEVKLFAPHSISVLNSTIERLTNKYVKKTAVEDFEQLLIAYFEHFNFNKTEMGLSLLMFMDRKDQLKEKSFFK